MKKLRVDGNFLLALLINMLFHLEGTLPAWILLILHYVIGLSVKWFWIALGIWLGGILIWMIAAGWIYGWAAQSGNTPDPPKKNVNPYSVGAAPQETDGHGQENRKIE